ncbi:aminotransferase class V-fold PLP-dependent enzyme, partial [Bacteriovoracaceae bacterium]|nr:aminotransferase class V-fold PLP-dependent enzyme [Bacteriovoracaceae bacterium]
MSFDITKIREQFPTLSEQVKGHQLVYLDNGATTLKPVTVIEAINTYNQKETSNVHRGIHTLSELSTAKYERTRDLVQALIGANKREEIIFTKGTTESLNLLAYTLGHSINAGDEIIISQMEHHSNIVPWQMLCERKEAKLKVIPMNEKGELVISDFEEFISDRTKIVSVNWISNSLGT